MVFFGYSIFLILLFSIQTTVLGLFSIAGITPDLALIFAFYCGIYFQENTGVAVAGTAGFFQDCLSGGLLGINTLSKSLIGFCIFNLKNQFLFENVFTVCVLLVLASFFDGLIYYSVSVMLLKEAVPDGFLFPSLPLFAVYNALVGPLLFFVINWGRKYFRQKTASSSSRLL